MDLINKIRTERILSAEKLCAETLGDLLSDDTKKKCGINDKEIVEAFQNMITENSLVLDEGQIGFLIHSELKIGLATIRLGRINNG